MTTANLETASFTGLVDLASERLGGRALLASDEFFAEKENLLKPGRGVFIVDKYTENGKWMDGWESRRKRVPGYDWCILKLGQRGVIRGVDIDTNHFLGNHPPYASLEACIAEGNPSGEELASGKWEWVEILHRVSLRPGSQNLFAINAAPGSEGASWTHLRLNIYPDGGVARFRVYGDVTPNWEDQPQDATVDLAAVENGGKVVAASDMFFGNKDNLIMPGRSLNMGDGWETKRRRGPGHDWAGVQLGAPGAVEKIEVDTNHFKGNYPDRCIIEGCFQPDLAIDSLTVHDVAWTALVPETKLEAHKQHYFDKIEYHQPLTHIRLSIFPDGGVSRLRVFGKRATGMW